MRPADGSASSGPLRRDPAFFPPAFAGEGARRRAVFRFFAKRKRLADSPERMAIPFEEMTEPQRLSRRMPDVVRPAPTQGESLDRFDRPDRGLDTMQLATAASHRNPACSIKSDFGAELSLARLPSALLSRTWRGRPPLSPDRSRHRGVDARPLSLRLDPLTHRLESLPGFSLSRVVVRTNRSEPPDFYDHEAHELTFSDLRTCVCRVFELSARKKSGSMRFSYPHRLREAPHKLSTGS
jgi:hypothetical protein